MASRFTRDDVLGLAALARLELTEQDIAKFCEQLTHILEYADVVQQIDTSAAPPHWSPGAPSALPWREDEVRPGLDRDELLGQAPDAAPASGLFRVPKVLG